MKKVEETKEEKEIDIVDQFSNINFDGKPEDSPECS